jgi:hypothetical protein
MNTRLPTVNARAWIDAAASCAPSPVTTRAPLTSLPTRLDHTAGSCSGAPCARSSAEVTGAGTRVGVNVSVADLAIACSGSASVRACLPGTSLAPGASNTSASVFARLPGALAALRVVPSAANPEPRRLSLSCMTSPRDERSLSTTASRDFHPPSRRFEPTEYTVLLTPAIFAAREDVSAAIIGNGEAAIPARLFLSSSASQLARYPNPETIGSELV